MHNLTKNKKFIFEFDYDSLFYYIVKIIDKINQNIK